MKTVQIDELFYTTWKGMGAQRQLSVWEILEQYEAETDTIRRGVCIIAILRLLRKKPLLVDQINEEQAAGCWLAIRPNLTPWHQTIDLAGGTNPVEYFHAINFEQFIHADHQFSIACLQMAKGVPCADALNKLTSFLYCGGEVTDHDRVLDALHRLPKRQQWKIQHVAQTYAHVRKWLTATHPALMGGGGASADASGPVWQEIKHRAAESPAFADMRSVERMPYLKVLDYLESVAKRKQDE